MSSQRQQQMFPTPRFVPKGFAHQHSHININLTSHINTLIQNFLILTMSPEKFQPCFHSHLSHRRRREILGEGTVIEATQVSKRQFLLFFPHPASCSLTKHKPSQSLWCSRRETMLRPIRRMSWSPPTTTLMTTARVSWTFLRSENTNKVFFLQENSSTIGWLEQSQPLHIHTRLVVVDNPSLYKCLN